MQSFWDALHKPFFVMAPMADVTDPAFRHLMAKCGKPHEIGEAAISRGKPDVMWTEFVSADGLYHTREIQKMPDTENPLMRDLLFSEAERPIVAQIFSGNPKMIAYAAKLAEKLGFDGVDINMGCPVGKIVGQGAGSDLILDAPRAQEIIRAAQEATHLPVSVKTRVGYNAEVLDEWLPALFEAKPAAVTLHLRTRKEMSLVPANWELMKKAVLLRDQLAPGVLMLGNGDVKDLEDAKAKAAASGADGVMIGRGMFGNPWVFNPAAVSGLNAKELQLEKMKALVDLAHDFEKLRPRKNFSILKKHIKAFVTGFDGAADLRAKLMEAEDAASLERILKENRLY